MDGSKDSSTCIGTMRRKLQAEARDVYLLGLTIVLGGHLIFWNEGLRIGFWRFFCCLLFAGSGYFCLTCCLAEMTSMMPFAGGSFGYVRCTLGPVMGYVVGCCEAAEYILYVAAAVQEFGRLLTQISGLSPSVEPLYWVGFYVLSIFLQCRSRKTFWTFNAVVAIVTTALIVMYCLACLPYVNFSRFAVGDSQSSHGVEESFGDTMYFYPLVCWFYIGIEAVTLACDDVSQANRKVPRAMMQSIVTLIVISLCVLFTTTSQYPGTIFLSQQRLPLSPGYSRAFGLHSQSFLALLALPGTYSTAYGFMFAYGRQLNAMSRSGLLPASLGVSYGAEGAPLTALMTGSIMGCVVLLILWLCIPTAFDRLFSVCMLSSCTVYCAIFASFLIARQRLDSVPRPFRSPLGVTGAVYGLVVFSVMAVALAGFQRDYGASVIVYVSCVALALLHYWFVARKREFLSLEEQAQFMKAYLLHTDAEYRRRMVKRSFRTKQAFIRRIAPFFTSRQADGNQQQVTARSGAERLRIEPGAHMVAPAPSKPIHHANDSNDDQRLDNRGGEQQAEWQKQLLHMADEMFGGHDDGHVTVVNSRYVRRSLAYTWQEHQESSSPVTGESDKKKTRSYSPVPDWIFSQDGAALEIPTKAPSLTVISRTILLTETPTTVEIIFSPEEELQPRRRRGSSSSSGREIELELRPDDSIASLPSMEEEIVGAEEREAGTEVYTPRPPVTTDSS